MRDTQIYIETHTMRDTHTGERDPQDIEIHPERVTYTYTHSERNTDTLQDNHIHTQRHTESHTLRETHTDIETDTTLRDTHIQRKTHRLRRGYWPETLRETHNERDGCTQTH